MSKTDQQNDSYLASGTSPPAAVAVYHKRSDYIAEGFKNRTHGEAKYNFRTYVGLGFFGALAASLGLTVALRVSTWIAPHYQKIVSWTANATKFGRTGDALKAHHKTVSSLATIFSMFGGTTLVAILPIKWREDRKADIIKQYDRDYYGDARVEHDPSIKEAHALIEAAPKQTWKSVIGSRAVAFGATMGVAALVGATTSVLGKSRGWSIDKMSIKAGRGIDRFLHRGNADVAQHIAAVAAHSPNELVREGAQVDRLTSRIANYLTLDSLYTFMTSGVLFVFTRLLAPVFDKNLRERENTLAPDLRADIGRRSARPLPRQGSAPDASPTLQISEAQHEQRLEQDTPQPAR